MPGPARPKTAEEEFLHEAVPAVINDPSRYAEFVEKARRLHLPNVESVAGILGRLSQGVKSIGTDASIMRGGT